MSLPRAVAAAALSLMFASPAPVAAQPAQLQVQVWSYGFLPRPIRLVAGRPVTMTFVNLSGASHDFVARSFFQHARIISGSAPMAMIDLDPHETKSITLIPARGTYEAHCSHFFHKQLGMSDVIEVF